MRTQYHSLLICPLVLAISSTPLAVAPLSAQELVEHEFPKPAATLKDGLKSVRAIYELKDGRVLLFDGGAQKLLTADLATGKLDTRMSDGPEEGEFRTIGPLWAWPGDSVATFDAGKARLVIMGPDGQPERTAPFGPPGMGAGMPAGMPAGGGRGGASRIPTLRTLIGTSMVLATGPQARPTLPPSPASPPPVTPYPVLRLSLRNFRGDTVVQLMPAQSPRPPATIQSVGTFTVYVGTAPLQSVDVWAAYRDGTVAVVRAATYRIEYFAPDGTRSSAEPVPFTPIPVSSADKKRVVEEYKRVGEAALAALPTRTSILAVAYEEPRAWPETHPPFRSDIAPLVDPQERLWLATRCLKDESALCYDVIDRRGARVERYHLPAKTRVVGFGQDVVYTVFEQKSEKDVLQRHPLR